MENIHKIVYINLDRREDRKKELEEQLARLGIERFNPATNGASADLIRFPAIEHAYPIAGCSLSHAAVLDMARKESWPNVLILEDDFNFIDDIIKVKEDIKAFFASEQAKTYDVIQLAYNIYEQEPVNALLCKATRSHTCSGYLVHQRSYDRLHYHINSGAEEMSKILSHEWAYACDVVWNAVQRQGEFYAFNARLGYQRPSYSDLGLRFVNYGV